LNAVIPHGDPDYNATNRPTLYIPPAEAIDLNGFVISGVTTCSGAPVTSCAPTGTGIGIDGSAVGPDHWSCSVAPGSTHLVTYDPPPEYSGALFEARCSSGTWRVDGEDTGNTVLVEERAIEWVAPLSEGAVPEHRDCGRVDASRQSIDRRAVAHGGLDFLHLLVDEAFGVKFLGGDFRYHPMTSLCRTFATMSSDEPAKPRPASFADERFYRMNGSCGMVNSHH